MTASSGDEVICIRVHEIHVHSTLATCTFCKLVVKEEKQKPQTIYHTQTVQTRKHKTTIGHVHVWSNDVIIQPGTVQILLCSRNSYMYMHVR